MQRKLTSTTPNCPWYIEELQEGESHCLTCIKRNLSLFSELSRDELIKLNSRKRTLYFSKGEAIFKQDLRPAGLFALSKGKVKNVRITDAGISHLIDLKKPVNFLGFSDLINEHAHLCSAIALENCAVCFIPADDFLDILSKNQRLSLRSMQFISEQYRRFVERSSNLVGKNMRGRMADTLLFIYDFFEVNKTLQEVKIDLNRSDYASMAQMNTANAIRTIGDFSKSGLIELKGNNLLFKNISALRQISSNE